ncbi:hypothetical protein BGX27_003635 [Mortierella sp. AM989]|nr:hypothetical protein BGX27_003635 [Mortierella sp. AM989]
MTDSTSTPNALNSSIKRTKLVRTQTPVPDSVLSHFTFREATLKGATTANTLLNKNLTLESPLCRDINDNIDNDSNSNIDSDDESDNEQVQEDDHENDGRERTSTILDLDSAPANFPSFASATSPSSPRALAMQADKKSKRVRMDASATIKKTVRFDESRNTEHPHYSEDKRFNQFGSSISTRTFTSASATRPVISALIRRQSSSITSSSNAPRPPFSPFTFNVNNINNVNAENTPTNQFSLSLENTSQDVMDFASSLSRLMGGSADNNNSNTNFLSSPFSQASFSSSASSPLRSFSPTFQNSPPSPVRPSFLAAYSPPMASSLSSCWSPTLGSDRDGDETMESCSQPLSPPRPVSRAQSSSSSGKFIPRRPRISSPMRPQQQVSLTSGARPRFPSMLKREASNASFLDNYPSSLVADESSDELPMPQAPVTPLRQLPVNPTIQSSAPNHAAIAAAVLNMPSLTKSISDMSSTKSSFEFDATSQHKRSSSWDLGQSITTATTSATVPAPLSFAPLFPLAPNRRQLEATSPLSPTPPDSQLQ